MKLRNYGKTLVLSLLLCFGIGARADNVVRISSAQGAPDEEVTVSISLENTDAVSSLQVSIPLDENLTLVEGSGLLGSRCGGHSLTIGVKDDVLNVLVYSLSMAAITGNSGEVVSFKLRLGNQPETVTLAPTKIMLTNTDGTKVSGSTEGGTVTTFCAKAQYSMMEVDFGEVPIRSTYQKTVTVANVGNADLTITALTFSDVNVFSSTTTLPLTISAGESKDLNITYKPVERGSINKSLKVVCNSVSKLNTITLKAQPFAVNELHVQDVAGVSEEEVTVSMTMNNMDDINGYQVEFALPEQLEYVDGSFALSSRKQDHASAVSLTGNVLRIIAYSSSDKPLTGNDGEIGSFKVRLAGRYGTTLTPSKVVLSATINNKVENVVSAVYGGQVTISSPQISTSDELNFGAVPVTESCEREFAISNYGSALLTVSRVVFNNDNLSIRESLPLVVPVGGTENITVVYGSTVQQAFTATMQIYNNDPDLRVKEVSVSGSRFAPNYLSVYTKDISESENLSIDFSLDNYDIVKGLQFDVVYPGQYYTTFDNNYTLESRAEGMSVTIRQIDTNTLRVFCYFLNGSGISAGEGKIMNLQLKPKEEVPLGNYSVSVKDIKFSVEELEDKYAGTDIQSSFTVNDGTPVTITAKSYTIKYGDEIPAFEFTSDGATLEGTPSITCEATSASPVGTYPIVISKGSVTNYNVTYVNGTLTIEKAPLKITAKDYTIKQGETLPTFEATYEGFKNNETSAVLTKQPVLSTTATSASEPGEYEITVSGAEAQNYEVSYVKGKLTIVDADALIITAKSYTIKYGDDIPAFEFTSDGATLEGTPSITCEATSASPVGTYPIVISKGSVTNYNVTYVNGALTIEKAPLKITAKDYTIKQGETLPTFEATYEGFKNNETSEVLTKQPTITITATSASEPGEYEITVSGGEAQNYEMSYVKGKLTIVNADALIITAKSYTIKYGDEIPAFEFTSDGATLEGTPSITCEATSASPVGTYPIVISKGSVTNYNVTYVNGTLTIEKAPLKITAKDYTIKQGETLPDFEVTYEGFKNNETSTVLTKQPVITTTATSASEPGEYEITVSGAEAQNYEMSYVKGKLTIVDADALIITAKSYTIKYGDEIPAFEFTSDGATLEGTPAITCEATSASPVGTYPIVISKGSVTNYNVTYVNGTLTIEKAPLKITAKDYTIKQGETLPTFEATYEGFKNNETSAVLTKQPVLSTTATSASEPGEYEITVSGAEAQNYEVSYVKGKLTIVDADALIITAKSYTIKYGDDIPAFEFTSDGATLEGTPSITCEATSASPVGTYPIVISKGSVTNYNVTYVNGTLTIEKAPLKITAKDYTIKQGETLPTFEATYEGFKNNETSAVLTKQPTITTTATSASEPGEYEITVSGAEAQNYEISYVKGKLTIVDADALIITAKSYTIKYGDEIPAFEFTSDGATLEGTPAITCEATSASPVGTYPIVISKGSVTNFNVTYVNGTLTIEKAPLKITAKDYTIKQGETLPTFEATYDGFKNNETATVLTKKPVFSTTATSASEPGEYEITVSGAEAQNYEMSYVSGKLTITEASGIIGISVDNPMDIYDLQGNKVRYRATSLEGLPKGVYIINGRKVIVK